MYSSDMVPYILALVLSVVTGDLPDASTGEIDGKVALRLAPITASKERIDPEGCEVHVVSDRGRGKEQRFPCGQWFLPGPAGAYLVWLEQGDTISAAPAIVLYSEVPFHGSGASAYHVMVPAGFVSLTPPAGAEGVDSLRLMAIRRDGGLRPFERKVRLDDVTGGRVVRMPAGSILAGLYDEQGNAVALSRPVRVTAGEQVRVTPELPARGSGAVLFSFQRPAHSYPPASMFLAQGARTIVPDVMHESEERVVAMWYSVLGPSSGVIRFESEGLPAKPNPVSIAAGKVTTVRGSLKEKSP